MKDLELLLPHHPSDSVYKYRGRFKKTKKTPNLQIIIKIM